MAMERAEQGTTVSNMQLEEEEWNNGRNYTIEEWAMKANKKGDEFYFYVMDI